jgi:hypothetical protein
LLAGGGLMFWLDGARAREFATTLVQRYCRNRDLQFLDGTVVLARMGVRWTKEGLRIRRMFRFDFSLEGAGRRTGYILMLGTRLELIDDGLPAPEERVVNPPEASDTRDRKVIPFRRRDR